VLSAHAIFKPTHMRAATTDIARTTALKITGRSGPQKKTKAGDAELLGCSTINSFFMKKPMPGKPKKKGLSRAGRKNKVAPVPGVTSSKRPLELNAAAAGLFPIHLVLR
jgi:hypothetical protein